MAWENNYNNQRKRKHINVTLCPSVRETLIKYCADELDKNGKKINKSRVIEVALRSFFRERNIPLVEVEEDDI